MADGRFNFFAPAQQPVDFGIMQRAAEASAALYAGAGEAIGRGLARSEAQKREDALRKEKQQKLDSFTKEEQNPENYDQVTYRLGDVALREVMMQAKPGMERSAVREYYINTAKYPEAQAEALATAMTETRTARVMRPGAAPKLRAMAFDLVGNQYIGADELDALTGENTFEDMNGLLNHQLDLARGIGQPQELSQLALLNARTEQELKLLAQSFENSKSQSFFESTLAKDRAQFESDLSMTAARDLDKLKAGAELRQKQIEDDLSAARQSRDEASQRRLMQDQEDIGIRLELIRNAHDERMLERKIGADAEAAGSGLNETQRKALKDIANSVVSPNDPLGSLPLQSLYDDNTLAGASEIVQDLGASGLDTGMFANRQERERILSGATIKATIKNGELGIDVDVPNAPGSRTEIETALEKVILSRFRASGIEAPAVVAVRQLMGGLPFTDAHRDVLNEGLMSPELNKLLGIEIGRIATPVVGTTPPPAAPAAPAGAAPADDNTIGGPAPSRGVLPGAR